MPRKSKEVDKNENLEYDYVYRCTECGFETTKPNGKFYKSLYSTSYKHNNQYCHICKACLIQKFENYSKKYDEETAMILICHKIDVPFYYETYRSIINQNNVFNIGMYFRVLTNVQYTNHCFDQTILTRELNKDKEDIRESVEAKWSREEIANKKSAIELVGYDPFEQHQELDRKYLFSELTRFFDDDIEDDPYKLSQIIQIVNNNNQIRNFDLLISKMNPVKDSREIKELNSIKKMLVDANDKIAKENEISVKNRSNKEAGKNTLTALQRKLRLMDFDKAEADYYDQLTSKGSLWAIDMSNKAILQNTFFDENDKNEIFERNRKLVKDKDDEIDDLKEKNRLLNVELDRCRAIMKEKRIKEVDIYGTSENSIRTET